MAKYCLTAIKYYAVENSIPLILSRISKQELELSSLKNRAYFLLLWAPAQPYNITFTVAECVCPCMSQIGIPTSIATKDTLPDTCASNLTVLTFHRSAIV